jgi:hypothetical protein
MRKMEDELELVDVISDMVDGLQDDSLDKDVFNKK